MKLLLTGAGGFIGSALLPALNTSACQIRALYRTPPVSKLPEVVEVLSGDLCDEDLCIQGCIGVDVIVHLAGQAHVQSSKGSHIRNTYETSSKLVKAALAQGVKKFIYISSTKANYPLHSPYAEVKLATEKMLLNLHAKGDIQVVCLRPSLIYGRGMRGNLATLLKLLRYSALPAFPSSSIPLGMISLQDCCKAIALALNNESLGGASWELNDGQEYSLDALVKQIREYLGFAPPWLHLPEVSVKLAAKLAELSSPLTGTSIGMGTYRGLFKEPYEPDNNFAMKTGFIPQQTFHTELSVLMESTQ